MKLKLLKNKVNLTIGAYLKTEERDQIFSLSDSYVYLSVGFVYKEGITRINSIASIITPFSGYLWLLILGISITSILLILLTKKLTRKWRHFYIGGRKNRNPILNAWAIALGHSIANPRIANGRSVGNFARTLIILWIIMWFIIRSFYEGALYSYLERNRLPSPYDTIEKVLTSDCKIVASTYYYSTVKHLIKKDR